MFGAGSVHLAKKEFNLALQYFHMAVEAGYVRALLWVGHLHRQGLGLPCNLELAERYYKMAAEKGYFAAERNLLQLEFQRGTLLRKLIVIGKYARMVFRAAFLAVRDSKDERLFDLDGRSK